MSLYLIVLHCFFIQLQRNNDCKGGMMEEWHQKLHNNTSPDDVIICQVFRILLNKIFADLNVYVYTL